MYLCLLLIVACCKVGIFNKDEPFKKFYESDNLCYFHIKTSDSYNETHGQVRRSVNLTYFTRSQVNKGKSLSSRYLHLQFLLLPY